MTVMVRPKYSNYKKSQNPLRANLRCLNALGYQVPGLETTKNNVAFA